MSRQFLRSLDLPPPRPVQERLHQLTAAQLVVQDFRPLASSLEWELGRYSWSNEGLHQFASGRVPFIINNNGRFSEAAARVLFANLSEQPPGDVFEIVELGAGCGLFAREFLNSFAGLCQAGQRDWFGRLVYIATDMSRRTVEKWRELGIFEDFRSHMRLGLCDATQPESAVGLDGEPLRPTELRGVISNYVLDVLPSAVIRGGREGPEQLVVRTKLTRSPEVLRTYTSLAPEEVRALGASNDPKTRAKLAPLLPVLEVDATFQRIEEPALPYQSLALADPKADRPAILNYGALQAIDRWLALTSPRGFMLISDYGAVGCDQSSALLPQRFGDTIAIGINFPVLTHLIDAAGFRIAVPPGDDDRIIHSRLIIKEQLEDTERAFSGLFCHEADIWFEQPAVEAARLAAAGRNEEALDKFRIAVTRSPRNWQLIGNVAEFVGLQIGEHKMGAELARSALEINPWFSPWLWNILGDCLFGMNQREQAHQSYLQALQIAPRDARTHFNLSFTYFERGDLRQALLAVAEAIAADDTAAYRDRLLAKQAQIIEAINARQAHRATMFDSAAAVGELLAAEPSDSVAGAQAISSNSALGDQNSSCTGLSSGRVDNAAPTAYADSSAP
jgi:tetratricopeptide (TPR) repeat protein